MSWGLTLLYLIGGLEHEWIMIFHINWEWNNHPN